MKPGDMVRFAKWGEFDYNENWSLAEKKRVGILVEHDKIMGHVVILYKGELLTMRAQLAEKAGKKDFNV
tara:strand:- start:16920 stop:17126 length:207 start_codon:yes stop_codon:yes gene_type:complete